MVKHNKVNLGREMDTNLKKGERKKGLRQEKSPKGGKKEHGCIKLACLKRETEAGRKAVAGEGKDFGVGPFYVKRTGDFGRCNKGK